jgi:hypothetical protein
MSLTDLLEHHHFRSHPFDAWIAEDETALQKWFVAPPFQNRILGYEQRKDITPRPRSHVIFGKLGAGKTAICKKVESELLERAPNSLVLRYKDFSNPLGSSERPSITAHIEEILRLATTELIGFWTKLPDRYPRLGVIQKAELAGLVNHYFESLPLETKWHYTYKLSPIAGRLLSTVKSGGHALVDTYNATISVIKKEKIEPTIWDNSDSSDVGKGNPHLRLQRFWHLANAFGVESIWVLVDRIDESPGLTKGEAIFKCIADLLLSQRIMLFRDQYDKQVICFKVFLSRPEYVLPLLKEEDFRLDRIETHTIDWNRKDLDKALTRRLAYYSYDKTLSFDEICDPDAQGTTASHFVSHGI